MISIDQQIKRLFSFKRLSVDIFIKLEALREEEESNKSENFLKALKAVQEEEENFFFDGEEDAEQNRGYEDVNMTEDGDIYEDLQARYDRDCERGYFLQPVYVQKIKRKIHLYDELVGDMLKEFHQRIVKKRQLIQKVKLKCKEVALRDVMVVCDRC